MNTVFTLNELAHSLNARLQGDGRLTITGVCNLKPGKTHCLSFCRPGKFTQALAETQSAAVIVSAEDATHCPTPCLIVDNPELAFAKVAQLFSAASQARTPGIHPSAIIGERCQLGKDIYVGPYVVIEDDVSLGEHTQIHAHSFIGQGSQIASHCLIWPRVTLYPKVTLGERCIIHSGAVIGSDGFGFTPGPNGWEKVPQLGSVEIAQGVEIGANTTIDRGTLEATLIEEGVKLDNLIQLAHNTKIGQNTVIAACTGVAGSTSIGKNCIIAGGVGFAGHISVCDGTTITGMAMVTRSIDEPGVYSSGTGLLPSQDWRKNAVRFRQLNELASRVKTLETQLQALLAKDSHD